MHSALTVATPWYPLPYNRMAGSFVAEHARIASQIPAVQAGGGVRVVHALEWPGGTVAAAQHLQPAFDAVLDRIRTTDGTNISGAVGPVHRAPVFTIGGASMAERALAAVRDTQRAYGNFESPIVHGHVGYLGGVLAAQLADPGAKVFATEHSTGLRDVLAQSAVRDLYAQVIDRAQAVYCVSSLLRDQILEHLADPRGVVQVLHNPVNFTDVPRRSSPPEHLDRWVFVGAFTERKGVVRLVQAFVKVAKENPSVSLTMFGEGALRDQLVDIANDAGVADRLHLPGVVQHPELIGQLPEFDVLFAPSTYETFHLAVPEAVAAGLPVIVTTSGGPQEALAGVENQVGRFVAVNDNPDELVQAYEDLNAHIDDLDIAAAQHTLNARYGIAAIRSRLAADYGLATSNIAPTVVTQSSGGVPAPRSSTADASAARHDNSATAAVPRQRDNRETTIDLSVIDAEKPLQIQRIVLLSVSGWRRYSTVAEITALLDAGLKAVVVTADEQIARLAYDNGLDVVSPSALNLRPPAPAIAEKTSVYRRLRRWAGNVKRQLRNRPVPRALPESDMFIGATMVVVDCQSMPLAQTILAAYPQLPVVTELDRRGVLAPPADSQEEAWAKPAVVSNLMS